MTKRFNIRVYGLLIDENDRILVSDECIRGNFYTKFPGGGMEQGEGTIECIVREFREETGLKISIDSHFYTTDFFQSSFFNREEQIISIYYKVSALELNNLPVKTRQFDFDLPQLEDQNEQKEAMRWIRINELSEQDVSLPIDKIVVKMLLNEYQESRK